MFFHREPDKKGTRAGIYTGPHRNSELWAWALGFAQEWKTLLSTFNSCCPQMFQRGGVLVPTWSESPLNGGTPDQNQPRGKKIRGRHSPLTCRRTWKPKDNLLGPVGPGPKNVRTKMGTPTKSQTGLFKMLRSPILIHNPYCTTSTKGTPFVTQGKD